MIDMAFVAASQVASFVLGWWACDAYTRWRDRRKPPPF